MFTAYKDAHVVVTGGANGIGKALALGFAKRGANVAVVDIHGDEAKAVAAEITAMGCKSIAIQADVSVLDECAKVYDTVMDAFGRCDVLSELLRNPKTPKKVKTVAASALTQTADKKKSKK